MKLDHINLTVTRVLETSAFLKKYFGYSDFFEDNNEDISILGDGSGMHINLMRGKEPSYPKLFHIGFDMQTEAAVNDMYQRLTGDGMTIMAPKHAWGSWTFHFVCPGAEFTIEVACAAEGEAEWSG